MSLEKRVGCHSLPFFSNTYAYRYAFIYRYSQLCHIINKLNFIIKSCVCLQYTTEVIFYLKLGLGYFFI